jgi:1-aminocyclopropane-1-carboxylate deaminase/D-cysteine desulfhydrase-like pyridoxal-dependent ACC family enzyme
MLIPEYLIISGLIAIGTLAGLLLGLVRFVRRQRVIVLTTLQQVGQQQANTAQQMAQAIETIQRQQRQYEQQLQNVATAFLKMRHDLAVLTKRATPTVEKSDGGVSEDRVIH